MLLLFKNLLFTLVVPGSVGGFVPWMIAGDGLPAGGVTYALACGLFALGASIYVWCVWDFATFGEGTPAPIEAPKRLVVRGLYCWIRNPMYLGVLTCIVAWGALYQTAWLAAYAVVIFSVFQMFILLHEEPHLQREFGSEYTDYKTRVGRWLPRRPPAG
jgi:protein-S-isoprenylcysteine O-methyltransferase Ste14